jgi:hypothetical protein
MTTAFNSAGFLNEVMPDVPGCPVAMAINALRNATIDFCTRTQAWRASLDPINVVAATATYALAAPAAYPLADIGEIQKVMLDDTEIYPSNPVQLDAWFSQWRTLSTMGVAFYTRPDDERITLASLPDAAGVLQVEVSLVPARDATGMDTALYKRHLEAVAHGAKARLMAIPKKPWSDPATASYHLDEFNKAISGASVKAAQGNTNAPIRCKSYSK